MNIIKICSSKRPYSFLFRCLFLLLLMACDGTPFSARLLNTDVSLAGEMAVIIEKDYQVDLAVMDMATGRIGPILANYANQPAWRPGDDGVGYTRCEGDACAIYLTSREEPLLSDAGIQYRDGDWSGNGRYLAFSSRTHFSVNPDGVDDIYVYDFGVDPPELSQLTVDSGNNGEPAWSNDDDFIIFTSDRDGDFDIYLMKADGSSPVPITQNEVLDFAPAVSPDGTKVAYLSAVGKVPELFVFDIVTRQNQQLTNDGQSTLSPTWSPDGDYIAYLTQESGDQYQMNIILADGSSPPIPHSQLESGSYLNIAWRPAGEK